MKVTIFGSGYVGLVTATCFAQVGNQVTCVDVDPSRVARLSVGECPIHEKGLDAMLQSNIRSQRLRFVSDFTAALDADVYFIAVGTPSKEDGSADLRFVEQVALSLGQNLSMTSLVVNKSTVPVGTADKVRTIIKTELKRRGATFDVDVASNPEFLKEGRAVNDFMKPDRVIIGVSSAYAKSKLSVLYAPFNRNRDKLLVMDVRSAELTKYAANAMLATKISFMNEMSLLAESTGADIEQVRLGIGSDPRIGFQFIYPGCGYGGSCFPKDVRALSHLAEKHGLDSSLIKATHQVNENQKQVLCKKIAARFHGKLSGRRFAVWGLAFKPETDDVREAPSLTLIQSLLDAGAEVCAYDPAAIQNTHQYFGNRTSLHYAPDAYTALLSADALIIMTEWLEFRSPDFADIKAKLKEPLIFDGRNILSPTVLKDYGLEYVSIGRAPINIAAEAVC